MIDRIFLDVDGVLANWCGGVCKLFDIDYDDLMANWGEGWGIHQQIHVSVEEMWAAIDATDGDFWADLEPYPWTYNLFGYCHATAPTTILTSPSLHHSCAAGKVRWMDQHLSSDGEESFREFLIGPDKSVCAQPGAVLIDDKPKNCNDFILAGGDAIVFPRPWNGNRQHVGHELSYAVGRVQSLQNPAQMTF